MLIFLYIKKKMTYQMLKFLFKKMKLFLIKGLYLDFCFYWPIQCQSSSLKKMKLFLIKSLYLNFAKKVTCFLKQYCRNFTPVCRINCQSMWKCEWCIKTINEHMVCTPTFLLGGGRPPTKFRKKVRLDRTLVFRGGGGVAGNKGVTLFRGLQLLDRK